jgi:hypothetical protein
MRVFRYRDQVLQGQPIPEPEDVLLLPRRRCAGRLPPQRLQCFPCILIFRRHASYQQSVASLVQVLRPDKMTNVPCFVSIAERRQKTMASTLQMNVSWSGTNSDTEEEPIAKYREQIGDEGSGIDHLAFTHPLMQGFGPSARRDRRRRGECRHKTECLRHPAWKDL